MRRLFPRKPGAVALGAALAMVATTSAQAAAPCVTNAEFASLTQYALPSMVDGARLRCQNTLPATSFLRSSGVAMAARYRQGGNEAWPRARAAFLKIGNTGKDADLLMAAMPDDALRSTVDTVVQGLVVSQLPLEDCDRVDRLAIDIAPLSARTAADLFALLISLGTDKKGGKAGPFVLCPA